MKNPKNWGISINSGSILIMFTSISYIQRVPHFRVSILCFVEVIITVGIILYEEYGKIKRITNKLGELN